MIKVTGNITNAINELSNDENNAVAHVYKNAKSSSGELSNVVITLKDNYATNDAPTQASSLLLKGFTPKYDAEVVIRLKEAGAAIVGKTHLDELALGGTGEYSAFGIINNKLDSSRMPGGSSSGAAVTFSENISIAIGSDTGDSVRLPASYQGIVGFKPSYGAVSRFGLFPFASSLDTVSWFAHNVNDIIESAKVLYGVDTNDQTSVLVEKPVNKVTKPKTVSYFSMSNVLSEVANKEYEESIKKIKDDGIEVREIKINKELFELIDVVYSVISFSESSSNNSNLTGIPFGNSSDGSDWNDKVIKTRTNGFGDMVKRRFTLGSFFLLPENQEPIFKQAQKVRRVLKNFFEEVLKDSILIYPTASIAPLWKEGKKKTWYSSFLSYSNLVGNPSISIPWIKEKNMPINMSVDGALYKDGELLSQALYLEELIGGKHE